MSMNPEPGRPYSADALGTPPTERVDARRRLERKRKLVGDIVAYGP